MAADSQSFAPPPGDPTDRNGRLFAGRIIDHGELAGTKCWSTLEHFIEQSSEERWRHASSLTNPQSQYEAQAFNDMLTALSEVEAWVLIENVRKGVRHA